MIRLLKRAWIPLLVVVVVVIGGMTVSRMRTFFGSDGISATPVVFGNDPEPFDPKVVKYEISGSGSYANINYLDLDAKPQRVDGAALPWRWSCVRRRRPRPPTFSRRETAVPSPAGSSSMTK